MRVLALETSGQGAAVALLAEGKALCERALEPKQRSAKYLAPLIQQLLQQAQWQPRDLQLIAVSRGPGSFTGLRVGITTAKTMAYALDCPLVGVPSLLVPAQQIVTLAPAGWAISSAQRNQFFAQRYVSQSGWVQVEGELQLLSASEWLARLQPGEAVTGSALAPIIAQLPPEVIVPPAELQQPSAAALGLLGEHLYQTGQRDDPFQLVPDYGRRTAAEEQWERLGRG